MAKKKKATKKTTKKKAKKATKKTAKKATKKTTVKKKATKKKTAKKAPTKKTTKAKVRKIAKKTAKKAAKPKSESVTEQLAPVTLGSVAVSTFVANIDPVTEEDDLFTGTDDTEGFESQDELIEEELDVEPEIEDLDDKTLTDLDDEDDEEGYF